AEAAPALRALQGAGQGERRVQRRVDVAARGACAQRCVRRQARHGQAQGFDPPVAALDVPVIGAQAATDHRHPAHARGPPGQPGPQRGQVDARGIEFDPGEIEPVAQSADRAPGGGDHHPPRLQQRNRGARFTDLEVAGDDPRQRAQLQRGAATRADLQTGRGADAREQQRGRGRGAQRQPREQEQDRHGQGGPRPDARPAPARAWRHGPVARGVHPPRRSGSSASTTAWGANPRRSSGRSPMPAKRTGIPNSRASANTTPPLAVPSSLVTTSPVTLTASWNRRSCASAFWPVVPSITIRTSCGAAGSILPSTRRILPSSAISPCWVCRRPAVSAISTSAPRERAACSASNATEAGSASWPWATTVTPLRSPQACSCATAAARKVSPAASISERPSSLNRRASLPMVVVLPTPLTPTVRITNGLAAG